MATKLVKPTLEHVRAIAADMRDEDAAEVWASHRHTPLEAMAMGFGMSDLSVVMEIDGDPLTMLGLVKGTALTGHGVPWLLSSRRALAHRREFLLQSPPIIEQMLSVCPRLSNHVHAENRLSVRWLKWLGFTVDKPQPLGVNKELFHKFHLER